MQLGETIATYDVALALRGESGKFDVTSPSGEIYQVTCKPNQAITNLQLSGNGNPQPFLVRKVAEPVCVPEKGASDLSETPAQARIAKTPFLIGTDVDDPQSETRGTLDPATETPESKAEIDDVGNLELLYDEAGPDSAHPTARVCLRSEASQNRGKLVTDTCTTFNQFDAEIRRLHAQLDDIRYRARKKFYQAQVIAAGA